MATLPTNAGEIQPRHRKFPSTPGIYFRDDINVDQATTDPVLYNNGGAITLSGAPLELTQGIARSEYVEAFEDFLAPSGTTLPPATPFYLTTADTSAGGSPTLDYVDDALNGEFILTHAATDEAEYLTLYGGDNLWIDPTKSPVIEYRIKITAAGDNIGANADLRIGLGSARNDTLDSVVSNLWFKIAGANQNIYLEGDDGTTDTDDADSAIDYAKSTWYVLKIDLSNLSAVEFSVNGTASAVTVSVPLLTASQKLQPLIEFHKASGTTADSVTVDYIHVRQQR